MTQLRFEVVTKRSAKARAAQAKPTGVVMKVGALLSFAVLIDLIRDGSSRERTTVLVVVGVLGLIWIYKDSRTSHERTFLALDDQGVSFGGTRFQTIAWAEISSIEETSGVIRLMDANNEQLRAIPKRGLRKPALRQIRECLEARVGSRIVEHSPETNSLPADLQEDYKSFAVPKRSELIFQISLFLLSLGYLVWVFLQE